MELIDHYISHRLEREEQILSMLATRPMTTSELRIAVYPDLDPRLSDAAAIQLLAHLIKLEAEGRARRVGEAWAVRSTPSV